MLTINDILIEDTFAEAFPMTACRVIVTAETAAWVHTAGQTATGYAASVIGCDAEAAVERELSPEETPDGRPGVSLLLFAFSRDAGLGPHRRHRHHRLRCLSDRLRRRGRHRARPVPRGDA